MRRTIPALCLFSLLAGLLGGCAPRQAEDSGALVVAATTYPLYCFTTAVTQGVPQVEVELVVDQEVSCLHDYTLTVQDMKVLDRADLLVLNGAGLEDFLEDALDQLTVERVDCSAGIELLPAQGHEDHDHDHSGHDHGHYDPHIWMSPANAQRMLAAIGEGLAQADPDHAQTYRDNAAAAAHAVEEALGYGALPPGDGSISLITFHDGFAYFAGYYNFPILRAIEEEEGSEASAREIVEVVELIQARRIPVIFTEVNGSESTANAIAREVPVAVEQLSMVMSGEEGGIEPYIQAIRANYQTILSAYEGGNQS